MDLSMHSGKAVLTESIRELILEVLPLVFKSLDSQDFVRQE